MEAVDAKVVDATVPEAEPEVEVDTTPLLPLELELAGIAEPPVIKNGEEYWNVLVFTSRVRFNP